MEERLGDQVDKFSKMFDYIAKKVGDKEAGIICNKLGLDNPHFAIKRSLEEYKKLADKMILARKILKEG